MSEESLNEYHFKHENLFNIWNNERDSSKKSSAVITFIFDAIKETSVSDEYRQAVEEKIRKFCYNLYKRWRSCYRLVEKFRVKYHNWLQKHFIINKYANVTHPEASTSAGRPCLSYEHKSERSKRREASEVSKDMDQKVNLIVQAASMTARKEGNTDLAVILKESTKSPKRATKIRKLLSSTKKDPIPLSLDEAIAFFHDNNLSKRQYINIRLENKNRNCNIYPTYNSLTDARKTCIPPGITITETTAKVPLKDLLEHTAKRIVLLQKEVIDNIISNNENNILEADFIFSYGFDGSSGHSVYKQRFEGSESSAGSDYSLFATTLIPLRFSTYNNIILWNNNTPHSIRFCRPLKLQYIKETTEQILKEKQNIDSEIDNLVHLTLQQNNKILKINFKLILTLIDGKVLSAITKTSSYQRCPICGATSQQILKIDNFRATEFTPKAENLCYGLSPLHAWIRFFECIINISYRLDIKKWQIKSEDKDKFIERKKEVQKQFWEQLALNIDKPKAGGSGNTNDGNTVRRAFQNIEKFANITGVDIDLLKNFKIILITISSPYEIHLEHFETFCFDTARLFKQKYSWYPMTPTIHKILIHGKQILEKCILPPGYTTEDAAECRHKFYKHDREFHARKCSRTENLQDIFNRAMETSDPLISSISMRNRRKTQHLKKPKLPPEVVALLRSPSIELSTPTSSTATDERSNEEESDEDEEELMLPMLTHLDNVELQSEDLI